MILTTMTRGAVAATVGLTLAIGVVNVARADAKADATAACAAADTAMKAAKDASMLWTTTGKLVKKAKAAMEKGEFDAAMKSCKKAEFEGNASVKQAAIEADAWKTRVPR